MTLHIEWNIEVVEWLEAYAQCGYSKGKETARLFELVEEAAEGGWQGFDPVDPSLSQGKSLRFFEAGRLTVVVQVLPPVMITVAAVAADPVDFPSLVATAASVV